MNNFAIVIPAAGRSSRMQGQDKLLRQVDGVAQLRRTVLFALSTGKRVMVTLPPGAADRRACLVGLDIAILDVPDHADGMSASLRVARSAAREDEGLMVLPADMPEISPEALRRLLRGHADTPSAILAGSQDDRRGHPVLIPADLVAALSNLSGDLGARDLVMQHADRLRTVPLAGRAAVLDLDTFEDWTAWQLSRVVPDHLTDRRPAASLPLAVARASGGDAVLAIITGVHGPSYRSVGSMMGLTKPAAAVDAVAVGNLTNGCIEADLAIHAQKVFADRRPLHLRYGAGSAFFDIRLPCGGALDVSLFPAPSRQTLDDIACLALNRGEIALDFAADGSSTLRPGRPTGWDGDRFILNLQPDIRLLVFGEGTEAAVFSAIAQAAGCDQLLHSPSHSTLEMATAMGCAAQLWSTTSLDALRTVDPWTAVVMFFHDHRSEIAALAEALRSPAFYIGAQGSRRVAEQRRAALIDAGAIIDDLDRIKGPIGLVPSTRDARTLAVSALAEILAVHAKSGHHSASRGAQKAKGARK